MSTNYPPDSSNWLRSATCKDFITQRLIVFVKAIRKVDDPTFNRLSNCFLAELFPVFKKYMIIGKQFPFLPPEELDHLAQMAFHNALIFLRDAANSGKEWKDQGANVRTYFMQVCQYKLLELTKETKRRQENTQKWIRALGSSAAEADSADWRIREQQLDLLDLALETLDPPKRQLIVWRHLEQRPVSEIAAKLNTSAEHCYSMIYEAMKLLRKKCQLLNEST